MAQDSVSEDDSDDDSDRKGMFGVCIIKKLTTVFKNESEHNTL